MLLRYLLYLYCTYINVHNEYYNVYIVHGNFLNDKDSYFNKNFFRKYDAFVQSTISCAV